MGDGCIVPYILVIAKVYLQFIRPNQMFRWGADRKVQIISDQLDGSAESRDPMGIRLWQRTETCAIFYLSQYFVNCLTPHHEQRDMERSRTVIGHKAVTEHSDWPGVTCVTYVRYCHVSCHLLTRDMWHEHCIKCHKMSKGRHNSGF